MNIASAARQQQFMAKAEQVSDSLIHSFWLPWAIIAFGVFVRINQFAHGRALWLDEIRLALNILNRSFADLTLPLDYDQGSPVGFLWLEKLMVELFGHSDAVLRLLPLAASILALLLFYAVARRLLRPRAMLLALLFFAVAGPVIYYGSEVKQYSSDVFVTVVVLWIGLELLSRTLTPARTILYALLGAGVRVLD
ncbi:MAG: glycosyltransferase family 39 protein, partial [Anaerolineae bacterium]|nr:glycosyltransferase family 39 protein [Anaerolineae bacterium]